MVIEINGIQKRIVAPDNLCRLYSEESVVCMERFCFNVRSLSFTLVEMPTSYGREKGHNQIRIMKVRCHNPKVEFMDFGFCLPRIKHIGFHETLNQAMVELEWYARIVCSKVEVKIETIDSEPVKHTDQ